MAKKSLDRLKLIEIKKANEFLALLSIEPMVRVLGKLKEKRVLTTKERIKMFILINGERSSLDIAKEVGVSSRAAQLFISDLVKQGLVNQGRKGRALIPSKNYEKIIEFFQLQEK